MSEAEKDLLSRARLGDEKAFDALVETALPKILGVARQVLRNDDEAWDAAQDACVKAWRALGEFRGDAAFSTWVCGIVTRTALDRLRGKARRESEQLDERAAARAAGPEATAERRALAKAIRGAIAGLPAPERAVFVMHEGAEMRYREIASELKIPIGTVMSRLHSARLRLRDSLGNWWKEVRS